LSQSVVADGPVKPVFGSVVDREAFRFARALPEAPAGLAALPLDAHVLAHSNELRDVRLVDARDRQIPYLLEERASSLRLRLELSPRERSGSRSVYRFELPYSNLPSSEMVLRTAARAFNREVRIRQHRGRVLTSAVWRSDSPDAAAPALRIELPYRAPRRLELVIDEGDNEPLVVDSADLVVDAASLRFIHPGTSLTLLYGNRSLDAPRYDLALLTQQLAGSKARELRPGPAPKAGGDDREGRKLFWIGMVVAAVVLVALMLRLVLVRPETSRAPSDST
jgi:hypothetical protein